MRAPRTGTALGLAMAAALCAGCGGAPEASDEPQVSVSLVKVCSTEDLAAETGHVMSVSSQPFVTVSLRNDSRQACEISGYPRLRASGVGADGKSRPLAVRVKRGDLFERKDPGRHLVRLEPGEAAIFHVGTATAYDGGTRTIDRLRVQVPGTPGTMSVRLSIEASRPPMRRIPLGVTALEHE